MHKNITLLLLSLNTLALMPVQAKDVRQKENKHEALQYHVNEEVNNADSRALFTRNQWGLTEKEWQRYEKLMRGARGSISPASISPIEVLGTHARNDQERMRYAKTWAKTIYEDTDRILEFQRAYNKAFDQMYGDIPIIDDAKLNLAKNQKNNIQEGDRILLFVRLEGCDKCNSVVRELLLTTENKSVQFDIFFIDAVKEKDDLKIREWARKNIYNKSKLKTGKITLNHDNNKLFRITGSPVTQVPIVFKSNEKETTQVFI